MRKLEERDRACKEAVNEFVLLSEKITCEGPSPFCLEIAPDVGQVQIHCKTCSGDLPCLLCLRCFRHGDHSGHVFNTVYVDNPYCCCGQSRGPKACCCSCHSGVIPESSDDPSVVSDLKRAFKASINALIALMVLPPFDGSSLESSLLDVVRVFDQKNWRLACYFDECFADSVFFNNILRHMPLLHSGCLADFCALLGYLKSMPVLGKAWYSNLLTYIPEFINYSDSMLSRTNHGDVPWELVFNTFSNMAIPHDSDISTLDVLDKCYQQLFQVSDEVQEMVLKSVSDFGIIVCDLQRQSFAQEVENRLVRLLVEECLKVWESRERVPNWPMSSQRQVHFVLCKRLKQMMLVNPEIGAMLWTQYYMITSELIRGKDIDSPCTDEPDLYHRCILYARVSIPSSFELSRLLLHPFKGKSLSQRKEWLESLAKKLDSTVDDLLNLPLLHCVRYIASFQAGVATRLFFTEKAHDKYLSENRIKYEKCFWLLQCIFQLHSSPKAVLECLFAAVLDSKAEAEPPELAGLLLTISMVLWDRSFNGNREHIRLLMTWLYMDRDDWMVGQLAQRLGNKIWDLPMSEIAVPCIDNVKGPVIRRRPDFKWHIVCPCVSPTTIVNTVTDFITSHRNASLPFPKWEEDKSLSRFLMEPRLLAFEFIILYQYIHSEWCVLHRFSVLMVYSLVKLTYDLFGDAEEVDTSSCISVDNVKELFRVQWPQSFSEFLHKPVKVGQSRELTVIDIIHEIGDEQSMELLQSLNIARPDTNSSAQERKQRAQKAKQAVLEQLHHQTDAIPVYQEEEDKNDMLVCTDCGRGADEEPLCFPLFGFPSSVARILAKADTVTYQAVMCLHPCHQSCMDQKCPDHEYHCSLDRRPANKLLPMLPKFETSISETGREILTRLFTDFDPLNALVSEIRIQEFRSRSSAGFYYTNSGVMVSELFNCCWIAHRCGLLIHSPVSNPLTMFVQRLICSDNPERDFDRIAKDTEAHLSRQIALARHMIFHPWSTPEMAPVPGAAKSIDHIDVPEELASFEDSPWNFSISMVPDSSGIDLLTGKLYTPEEDTLIKLGELEAICVSEGHSETILLLMLTGPWTGVAAVLLPDGLYVFVDSMYGNLDGIAVLASARGGMKLDVKKLDKILDMFVSGRWASHYERVVYQDLE